MKSIFEDQSLQTYLDIDTIKLFSPQNLSITEFREQKDIIIARQIYLDSPIAGKQVDSWNIKFSREFDMTNDRKLFNRNRIGLKLYEGKMIYQYNPAFGEAQYWVDEKKGRKRLLRKNPDEGQLLNYQTYRLVFRDIANKNNARTLISTILGKNNFLNNKVPFITALGDNRIDEPQILVYLVAILNSFILDWLIKKRVDATLNFFFMQELPIKRLEADNPYFDAIVPRAAALTCTTADFAELWQEVMGTAWEEPDPNQTSDVLETSDVFKPTSNPAARQLLRDELDAIVAHLYGLSRDEFAHILNTFPLVFPNTPEGEAKKATLLGVFDRFEGMFS